MTPAAPNALPTTAAPAAFPSTDRAAATTAPTTTAPGPTRARRLTSGLGLAGALLLPVALPVALATPAAASSPTTAVTGLPTSGTTSAQAGFGERVVEEAARHDGKPYRYGATGPDAFDCSGYVQYVFAQLGVDVPRTSADQYAASTKVAKADRQLGDLIAMRNSSGRVTHVGIYAGDDAWWVASTGSERVRHQALYRDDYSVGRFR